MLGFVGTDQGWGGLELLYEEQLQGREGRLLFPSDVYGRQIPHEIRSFVPPKEGMDLYLTIDETIQYIVERELDRAMLEYPAEKGHGHGRRPPHGGDPGGRLPAGFRSLHYGEYDPDYWPLLPVTSSFEPGSTFKLITLAAAIEEGLFNENEYFHCEPAMPP